VGGVRHPVELEDGDLAALRLTYRRLEIVEGPGRAGVPGGGDEQRVVQSRLVGEPAAVLVRVLRGAAPAGELDADP
jgi:hypothetical protein